MKKYIDARGDACPLPLIKARNALREMSSGILDICVDNRIAAENIEKMAVELKIGVEVKQSGESCFDIRLLKGDVDESSPEVIEPAAVHNNKRGGRRVVAVSSDRMGSGDEDLGRALIKSFIYALTEADSLPAEILFYNSGAYLTSEGSGSLDDLHKLIERGVVVLTCGACLNFYGLSDKLKVGSVTNMYNIVEIMQAADTIIKP